MQTKTIQLYTIEELKVQHPTGYKKAIENYQHNNEYHFLEEFINDRLSELLKENNIKADKTNIQYSLGYCQGDGAMFELTNATWQKYPDYIINVKHQGLYCHENSKTIAIERAESDNYNEAPANVYTEFDDLYTDICKQLAKTGYNYIEAENDDDNIVENMNANEYTFREDGTMENL